jgi:hypothetical protein
VCRKSLLVPYLLLDWKRRRLFPSEEIRTGNTHALRDKPSTFDCCLSSILHLATMNLFQVNDIRKKCDILIGGICAYDICTKRYFW